MREGALMTECWHVSTMALRAHRAWLFHFIFLRWEDAEPDCLVASHTQRSMSVSLMQSVLPSLCSGLQKSIHHQQGGLHMSMNKKISSSPLVRINSVAPKESRVTV